MFVRKEDTIELLRAKAAKRQPRYDLACAQSAIDEQPAMIGGDERAVPRASAAEHGQAKHFRLIADVNQLIKEKSDRIQRINKIEEKNFAENNRVNPVSLRQCEYSRFFRAVIKRTEGADFV